MALVLLHTCAEHRCPIGGPTADHFRESSFGGERRKGSMRIMQSSGGWRFEAEPEGGVSILAG